VIYGGYKNKNTILANLDTDQDYMSKLWGGPKAAIIVSHMFTEQKLEEILDAIDRLSPYPVTQTTLWGMTRH